MNYALKYKIELITTAAPISKPGFKTHFTSGLSLLFYAFGDLQTKLDDACFTFQERFKDSHHFLMVEHLAVPEAFI